MDFMLSDGTGTDATHLILKADPNCKIIFLTMSEEDEIFFLQFAAVPRDICLKICNHRNLSLPYGRFIKGKRPFKVNDPSLNEGVS